MIDLHVHSTYSDGTLTPAELLTMAKDSGLSAISITDHDTAEGTGEAMARGSLLDVSVISGLELSVVWQDYHLHLLGYDFNWQDSALLNGLKRVQEARAKRNSEILQKLQKIGIALEARELQHLSGNGQTGRPHIARLLMAKGIVRTVDQAFALYLKNGACAYVPRFLLTVEEAIALIHGAGGLAVLAHPVQISSSPEEIEKVAAALKKIGLDGLESYYPSQRGKLRRKLTKIAQKHDLLETGGSDYHGDIRPGTSMAGGANITVPDELITFIREKTRGSSKREKNVNAHDIDR